MAKNGTQHAQGYIYRGTNIGAEQLQTLLNELNLTGGWAWTPTNMYSLANQKEAKELLKGEQGRASNKELEIRWRQEGEQYDVLILSLNEQQPPGFKPFPAQNQPWPIQTAVDHQKLRSTRFLAPNGATQFVALIGRVELGFVEK